MAAGTPVYTINLPISDKARATVRVDSLPRVGRGTDIEDFELVEFAAKENQADPCGKKQWIVTVLRVYLTLETKSSGPLASTITLS